MFKLPTAPIFCCLILALCAESAWSGGDVPIELRMIEHESLDGDDGAQLLYGLAYLEGRDGLQPDAAKAVYWLRRAARSGNAYAQLVLGNCYADGTGVAKDPARAARWWQQAGQRDNPQAQYLIGRARLEGSGIEKDPARAVYWLTRSADQGNKDAQYLLGKMYYEGYQVAPDRQAAKNWLGRAAEQAHSDAINLLAVINGMVDMTTKVYQQSADVLISKARRGDPQAQYELGLRYESGAWDVSRDPKKALAWIVKAAQAGNRVAMKSLADIYRHGDLGVPADAVKAAAWEKKAAQPGRAAGDTAVPPAH